MVGFLWFCFIYCTVKVKMPCVYRVYLVHFTCSPYIFPLYNIYISILIYSVLFAVVSPDDIIYNICTMYNEDSDIESISASRSASDRDSLNAGPSSGTNHHHVLWRIQEAD